MNAFSRVAVNHVRFDKIKLEAFFLDLLAKGSWHYYRGLG